jgi:Dolichyl-phosphate-mannose-protein mannosyltransferase
LIPDSSAIPLFREAESRPEIGADASPIARHEKWALVALFLVLLGLRICYACFMTFNSDEAQHLHVVWGWANGLLQYRDVFDNHTPLFHILCAPVFRLFKETALILIYMRLAMIPVFALGLWFVVRIGERLFSRRIGLWAAVFTGFLPFFFLKTVEFRTDDLWTVLWLGAVAIAVGGPFHPRRLFAVGLMLGATFSVSMKTVLMLLGLLLAGGITVWQWKRSGGTLRTGNVMMGLGAGLAGVLVVPGLIIAYFAAQHALQPLYYCVIQHNILPDLGGKSPLNSRQICFPVALVALGFAAREIFRRSPDREVAARRAVVLLAAGFYFAFLKSYWPMVTPQDYPPVAPLGVLWLTPGILSLAGLLTARWTRLPRLAFPIALVVIEIAVIFRLIHPHPRVAGYLERVGKVLHCTDPADYVMDMKSGAIYRRRPFYYALENVTLRRMKLKLIADDIIPAIIRTRTCMVSEERLDYSDFDGRDFAFVKANYLTFCDSMRVAGKHLPVNAGSGSSKFEVPFPAEYVILTDEGPAEGMLDSKPYSGKVLLDIGPHEFISDHPQRPHVLCWAKAYERGFTPNFSPEQ